MSKWFEIYDCGCESDEVEGKKNLLGYCGTHGEDMRAVFPAFRSALKGAKDDVKRLRKPRVHWRTDGGP